MKTAEPLKIAELTGPADRRYGYPFAVDGLMTPEEACQFLAMSRDSLERLAAEDKIRKGKYPGKQMVRFCRRSVVLYAKSIEV